MRSKVLKAAALARVLSNFRAKGKRVVFTNGCFDILHPGHISYLKRAARLGDLLVIGLNSDRSVRALKGKARPVNNERDRAYVLSALPFVDYITVFGESTPEKLIRMLKPDILAKGGDWRLSDIVGSDFVRSRGGRVARIPFVKGYSTTSLIRKMRA
jgi:D-beta-D-heptose 7-phosphate kinase/D-beta-D-heptose 1-phosphate adenosyltransferase